VDLATHGLHSRLREGPSARGGERFGAEPAALSTGDKVHTSHDLPHVIRWIMEIQVANGNAIRTPHNLKPPSHRAPMSGILELNTKSDKRPRGRILGARGRAGIAIDDCSHVIYRELAQHQQLRFDLRGDEPAWAVFHLVILVGALSSRARCERMGHARLAFGA
jgi:hypothetical protein